MIERSLSDALGWMEVGTKLFLDAVNQVVDGLDVDTELEGWTRAHVVAHVASNAEALMNLVHWARTGDEKPMYASSEDRAIAIREGAKRRPGELHIWVRGTAARLQSALESLPSTDWSAHVRTAQGRQVPATEIPWMRSREVMVHAVDLRAGLDFEDLPSGFLLALVAEIVEKRSAAPGPSLVLRRTDGDGAWSLGDPTEPVALRGPLAAIAAYLAGRSCPNLAAPSGASLPQLPPWL